jgi:anti-sigma B factor antagonist
MELVVEANGSHSVLVATGEIDLSTSAQVDSAVIAALESQASHLTLDLTRVTFLDSSGLGVIVKALKRSRESGTTFDVVASNERVLKVFTITGLDSVITIYSELSGVPTE